MNAIQTLQKEKIHTEFEQQNIKQTIIELVIYFFFIRQTVVIT